jgi:hypothetical protein
MTWAKPNSRNSEFDTQVLKGELFRLASIELFGVSSSLTQSLTKNVFKEKLFRPHVQ